MAMGDLVIRLGLDIAALRADVGKAGSEMQRMFTAVDRQVAKSNALMTGFFNNMERGASRAANNLKGFAAAFVGFQAVTGIAREMGELIEKADALGESAEKVGLGVEQLQRWQYAAKLGGVQTEAFDSALVKLIKTFDDAAEGGKSAQETFARLGLAGEKLGAAGADTATLFRAVTDAIAGIEDPMQAAALSAELFGKAAGPQMLAAIRAGFDEIGKSATGVFSDEFAKNASDFSDAMDRLKGSMSDLLENVLNPMLPVLTDIAQAWADVFADVNKSESTVDSARERMAYWRETIGQVAIGLGYLADAIRVVTNTIAAALHLLSTFGRALISIYTAIDRVLHLDFRGAGQALSEGGRQMVESVKLAGKAIEELGYSYGESFAKKFAEQSAKTLRNELGMRIVPDVMARIRSEGKTRREIKPPKGEGDKAAKKAQSELEQAERRLFALEERNKREGIELQRRASQEELDIFLEQYEEQEKASKRLYELEVKNREEATKKAAEESEKQLKAWLDAFEKIEEESRKFQEIFTNNFGDALADVVTGTKSLSEAFKDMANSIVQSITRIAAQRLAESILGTRSSGGGGIGDFFAGLFGGGATAAAPFMGGGGVAAAFAGGGSFGAGRPMLVGERGPEIIVPSTAGTVVPNSAIGGNVNVVVNVPPVTDRRSADQMAASVGGAVQRAMKRNQ